MAPEHPDFWGRVREAGASNRRLRILLDGSQLVEVTDQHVLMEVSRGVFNVATASVKEIEALVAGVAGKALPVKLRPDAAPPAAGTPVEARPSAAEHPLVKQAQELFGARLVSVQPRPRG